MIARRESHEEETESSTLHLDISGAASSPSHLSPPTSSSSQRAAVFNLLNTVVGGGILSLPFASTSCGLGAGLLYQLLFGMASWYGSILLLDATHARPQCTSYEAVARSSLGRRGALVYNIAALVNCYGACVSYMVASADVIPPLLAEMGFSAGRSPVLIGMTAFVIFPLSALRNISALQYASGLAVLIYVAFAITLGYLAMSSPASSRPVAPILFKPDLAGWMRAIPLCAFAYVHQTSLFPIYQELEHPSQPRMREVVGASVGTATVLYILTTLAAYARFGEAIRGDILLNLAEIDSNGVRLVRLAFGLSVCLTYPCLHFAARQALDQLLFARPRAVAPGTGDGHAPYSRLLGLTCLLVGTSLGIALAVDHVEVVFGFTGAAASTMLSYILPAAIHLMARPHRLTNLRKNGATIAFILAGALCGLAALVNHSIESFRSMPGQLDPNIGPQST